MVESICSGDIGEIVVAYRDGLCRYGFELIETVCRHHGAKVLVRNVTEGDSDGGKEDGLAADLLTVCNFFIDRNNGRCAKRSRKRRRRQVSRAEGEAQADSGVEAASEQVVRDLEMDVRPVRGPREGPQGESVGP